MSCADKYISQQYAQVNAMETITITKDEVRIADGLPSSLQHNSELKTNLNDFSLDDEKIEQFLSQASARYLAQNVRPRSRQLLKLITTSIILILAIVLGSSYYGAISSNASSSSSHTTTQHTLIVHSITVSQP